METYAEEAEVEMQQRHEHEDQEDPPPQLEQVLRRAEVAERGNACEHAASFGPTLGQQEEEAAAQGQVPEGADAKQSLYIFKIRTKLFV